MLPSESVFVVFTMADRTRHDLSVACSLPSSAILHFLTLLQPWPTCCSMNMPSTLPPQEHCTYFTFCLKNSFFLICLFGPHRFRCHSNVTVREVFLSNLCNLSIPNLCHPNPDIPILLTLLFYHSIFMICHIIMLFVYLSVSSGLECRLFGLLWSVLYPQH